MKNYTSIIFFLLFALTGCNHTEEYYQELQDLPQIDMRDQYSYAGRYVVGDSLHIYGRFQQPQNPVSVTIGDVTAEIVKKSEISIWGGVDTLDRLSVIIAEEMGYGRNRPVTITSGNRTISGPPIEISEVVSLEPYAFAGTLALEPYASIPANAVTGYSHTGNGNLYYYNPSNNGFYRIAGGVQTVVLTIGRLQETFGGSFSIRAVQALAVDQSEQNLWIAARTGTSYELIRYHVATDQLTLLNSKPTPAQNVTGSYVNGSALGNLELAFSRLQPDHLGGLYAWVSSAGSTNAGVAYIGAQGLVDYLGSFGGNTALPAPLALDAASNSITISPEDGFLYGSVLNENAGATIRQYSLQDPRLVQSFTSASAVNNLGGDYYGLFGNIFLQSVANTGIRLENNTFLFFGNQSGSRDVFVTDFDRERVVRYAGGFNGNVLTSATLLNYDAEGHLYFAQGNTIYKTIIQ